MTTMYKALRKPVALWGVPMVPLVMSFTVLIIAAIWTTPFLFLLLPLNFFLLKALAKKDAHIFSLLALKMRTRGHGVANRFYGATVFKGIEQGSVDISEFLENMKLNQQATIRKHIPYSSHIHPNVVRGSDGSMFATWEFIGTSFDCESPESLEIITTQLNAMYRSYEGQPVTFWRHNVRESFTDDMTAETGNFYADELSRRYNDSLKQKGFRRNRLFLTVCYRPFTALDKSERRRLKERQKLSELDEALQDMLDIVKSLDSYLSRFTANKLSTFEQNGIVFSSQLSFYEYLLTHKWRKVRVSSTHASNLLGNADLYFTADSGQINHIDGATYFRGLEIKEFTPETGTGLMDALLYAPCDYVVTQSFTCMGREEARKSIVRTKKLLISADDDAISQRLDLDVALDLLGSGHISFGKHHYSLIVYANDLDTLVDDTGEISNGLNNIGVTPVRATIELPAAYLAQLPGNYTLRPRLGEISSQCFAEISCMHNFFPGKRDQAPWGEAIAILPTPSGGAYYLNLHNTLFGQDDFNEKTPFSTSVIGTNGSGKTVLAGFIAASLQKYSRSDSFSSSAVTKRLTTVYFDKDRGAEMNVLALGGRYYRLVAGEPTGFNPFSLPVNKRNVAFVKQLMKLLCTRDGSTITERDDRRLSMAVDRVMYELKPENRVYGITRMLENLSEPANVESQENGLHIRLAKWAQGGDYGWVFDNEHDTFDISDCENFGIDGTEFLDNKDICAPLSFYLLYRVTSLLDGRRLVIFMDEFWKWLNDPVFSDFAYNKLKTIRKLNGCIIPLTQSPAEIITNPIAPAVVEQCATQIFSANPNATREHYVDGLKVPEEVFEVIKSIDPARRQYVIIKNQFRRGDLKRFSALVTLDLSGLGGYIKVLSGSADNLEIFDSIYQPGMQPSDWLEPFLKKAL
ncbi:VirB4 family type IV secretion/conjugal transfer ATPase [Pantoea agglomerans]|uniref:VirB4 family type IV secretion/conjugal transfer ATPase n=1 Tax=Enterobacter agglomerans TaxID=549 RepID=UPI000DADCB06|nr:VirB3 family type IV secretion system protein [Pantoea agglomerans]RAH26331.1 ATPase [Pantoea agglomerans]TGX88185.1 ATPase [Pantoea agglomerans]